MTLPVQNKFFEFRQNNSGGSFIADDARGVGEYVVIEAADAEEANSLAQQKGIYFDGCDSGRDCSCCGDPLAVLQHPVGAVPLRDALL